MKKNQYVIMGYQHKKNWTLYVFLGILIFILIYFPFFALSMRYKTEYIVSMVFDILGSICLTFGGFMILLGVCSIFVGRKFFLRTFILGIVLLYLGCWLTGTVLEFFGFPIGQSENPGGTY
ncbi:MAG: hypothetical protein ACFFA6_12545 [Promethearchaeota archaeon]